MRPGGSLPFIICMSYHGGTIAITRNGRHVGVRVGDMVFDNLHPNGMPSDQWMKDFDAYGVWSSPASRLFRVVVMSQLIQLLQKIRQRPGMYIGWPSLSRLSGFLHGYAYAQFELQGDDVGPFLIQFPEWVERRLQAKPEFWEN